MNNEEEDTVAELEARAVKSHLKLWRKGCNVLSIYGRPS